jgi:hypothetical protein
MTIPFPKLGDEVLLLKVRAENNPHGPKYVEKQAIRTYVRGQPDENNHEKVERVSDPKIGTAKDEVWWSEFSAVKMNLDWNQTKCVKVSECPHTP